MTFKYISAAALAIGLASPVFAQGAAAPSAAQQAAVTTGTAVYGSDGTQIGTVARTEGEVILLDVDQRGVPIPRDAVTKGENGATINITKAALVAQFDQQIAAFEAKLDAALTTGAAVQTADGQELGTIRETTSEAVVVAGTGGPVTLPRQMMTLDNQGVLIVRATMEQIQQAISAQPSQG